MSVVGFARRALADARECGDVCGFLQDDDTTVLYMIDGLGHGPLAEAAALAASSCLKHRTRKPLQTTFFECNEEIRNTRGVAMGIAKIEENTGTLTYAGVGNTRIIFGNRRMKSFHSTPGIVGGGYGHLDEETHQLCSGDMVVMYTDGLKTEIDFAAYDPRYHADPTRLAERVLHDWGRGTDDAGVLVYRYVKPT